MKTKNLFLIPLLISNCHKISNDSKINDEKIAEVEKFIQENFQNEQLETLQNLNFADEVPTFCKSILNKDIWKFTEFYANNERFFKSLCNFDSFKDDELEDAKDEFKTLVQNFIEFDPVIVGKIIYLFENINIDDFNTFFSDIKSKEEKTKIANLLNLVASVYCQKTYNKSYILEIQNQNSRRNELKHNQLFLEQNNIGKQNINIPDFKSSTLEKPKLSAVRKYYENKSLVALGKNKIYDFDIDKISKKQQALTQLVNLAAGKKSLSKDPNFKFGEKFVKILEHISDEYIDQNTKQNSINIFRSICDICKKISKRIKKKIETPIDANGFSILISKLKNGTITSSTTWEIIIDAFNTNRKNNGVEKIKKDSSKRIIDLLSGPILNSTDLAMKTLNLMTDKSLEPHQIGLLLKKINDPKKNFSKQRNTENLLRLLDFDSLNDDNFKNLCDTIVYTYPGYSIYVTEETFVGMIKHLKVLNHNVLKAPIKNKFGFGNESGMSSIFILKCGPQKKDEIKKAYDL